MVQKSRLIEKIADLMAAGRLPLVADVRDESAEDVKIVIEPKSRTLDPALVMAQLYSQTELMSRFAMNMNVLDSHGVPRVMNLKEVLEAYVAHQSEVLTRRTNFRIGNVKKRLEILGGLLVAYLNIDAVIRIIRENDEPKPILMSQFKLSDMQAESILNMRLRSLRKLEEKQIKAEAADLKKELAELNLLVSDDKNKLRRITADVKEMRARFAKSKRMTEIDHDAAPAAVPAESMTAREPATILISAMGFIRTMKGHVDLDAEFSFKEGDSLAYAIHAHTNEKAVFATSTGQFYTLDISKISGGRGYGDVIRLMVEMPPEAEILDVFVPSPEMRLLLVSKMGYGFAVEGANTIASTKYGKSVMNPADGDSLRAAVEISAGDDSVAIIGNNRKLLVFPLSDVPVMARGKGVILQKYKEKGASLLDVITFRKSNGIGPKLKDVRMWEGKRADVGHMPPAGLRKLRK
ncbi:MAG: DNA topoisomerase IV subunit A, partial [Rickettsiales bacterium]|jgi:topoisomerase-4 subunit A|nr:DNA topoisomerase IV subunit A [Rickettsiales bacterium]